MGLSDWSRNKHSSMLTVPTYPCSMCGASWFWVWVLWDVWVSTTKTRLKQSLRYTGFKTPSIAALKVANSHMSRRLISSSGSSFERSDRSEWWGFYGTRCYVLPQTGHVSQQPHFYLTDTGTIQIWLTNFLDVRRGETGFLAWTSYLEDLLSIWCNTQ